MRVFMVLVGLCLVLAGCASSGPVVSKSELGNLEINVYTPDGERAKNAELHIDGLFVGNLTRRLPIIHARRGERTIAVKLEGYRPYERKITVLGDPNHQVLNIMLQKE
jgi:hypothetical protein